MTRQVEQPVDFGYGDLLRTVRDLHDFVSCANFSFLKYAEVESRALVRNEQAGHLRIGHADADSIAGDPRLGDLEQRAADTVTIADTDLVIGKTIDGEVFPELTVLEVLPLQLLLPVAVGIELIDHQGAMLSAVPCQVSLSVPVEVETPRHDSAGDRLLPNGSVDYFALPLDIARKTDIHRHYRVHLAHLRFVGTISRWFQ